jgi:hypothetical protein
MQLTHAARVESHVHARDVFGNAELAHGHLTGPTSGFKAHVGVGKGKAQVRQRAVIGGRGNQKIGILRVAREIARTGISSAVARPLGLRNLGVRSRCCQETAGRGSRQYCAA